MLIKLNFTKAQKICRRTRQDLLDRLMTRSNLFDPQQFRDYDAAFDRLIKIAANKRHWFECGEIAEEDYEEWFLNSFRFKIGLDKPSRDQTDSGDYKLYIMKELLQYMILAIEYETLPKQFNFEKFLKLAAVSAYFTIFPLYKMDFESKLITQHLKQMERAVHSFNACMMRQARHVTGLGCGVAENTGREKFIKRYEDLEIEIAEAIHSKNISFSDKKIFETVGGKAMWVTFYENMRVTTDEIDFMTYHNAREIARKRD